MPLDTAIGRCRTARANTSVRTLSYAVWFNSMRDRCQPGLRNFQVVLRRVEAHPDGADYLAVDDCGAHSGGDNRSRVGYFDRCFANTPGGSHGGYGHRISGLRGGFYGYESSDVWSHRGAYYGPMIPNGF